jgi:hypothetical protein
MPVFRHFQIGQRALSPGIGPIAVALSTSAFTAVSFKFNGLVQLTGSSALTGFALLLASPGSSSSIPSLHHNQPSTNPHMPTLPSRPLNPSRLNALIRKQPLLFGVPFIALMVATSFGLAAVTQTKYDYRDSRVKQVRCGFAGVFKRFGLFFSSGVPRLRFVFVVRRTPDALFLHSILSSFYFVLLRSFVIFLPQPRPLPSRTTAL